MDGAEYLAEVTRLSRVSGEKYQALSSFIERYRSQMGSFLRSLTDFAVSTPRLFRSGSTSVRLTQADRETSVS